jgi:[protein]-arginine 3-hydroxylase / protease
MKTSVSQDSIDTVERVHKPTREYFESNFFLPQKPCVITGAMDNWKAFSLWSIDYLKLNIGSKSAFCHVSSSDYFGKFYQIERINLSEFFDWLISEKPSNYSEELLTDKFSKNYFLTSLDIPNICPELLQDIEVPEHFNHTLLEKLYLWVGRGNNRVRIHYDSFHNLYAQVIGKKRWVIFPPEQSSLIYPYPWYHPLFWCSQVDANQPDLGKFPRFSEAKPLEVITEPGEILFLPAGWWHSPVGIGLNIAVNFWWHVRFREIISARRDLNGILRHIIADNMWNMLNLVLKVKRRLFPKSQAVAKVEN